jgi:periplasmic divalent cation tolerance protein
MTSDDRTLLIYTTFPSEADARRVGEHLVKTRLAGCVNIFSGMNAIFEWEGKLESAPETAMLIKTRGTRRDDVIAKVQELHPYSVPAILAVTPEHVAPTYEAWLMSQTAN